MFLQMAVNSIMGHLQLPGENAIVFHNHLFDPICGQQGLLATLLSVHLNSMDLGSMGIPFLFHIINLEKNVSRAIKGLMSVSLTLHSNFIILGKMWRYIAVEC